MSDNTIQSVNELLSEREELTTSIHFLSNRYGYDVSQALHVVNLMIKLMNILKIGGYECMSLYDVLREKLQDLNDNYFVSYEWTLNEEMLAGYIANSGSNQALHNDLQDTLKILKEIQKSLSRG